MEYHKAIAQDPEKLTRSNILYFTYTYKTYAPLICLCKFIKKQKNKLNKFKVIHKNYLLILIYFYFYFTIFLYSFFLYFFLKFYGNKHSQYMDHMFPQVLDVLPWALEQWLNSDHFGSIVMAKLCTEIDLHGIRVQFFLLHIQMFYFSKILCLLIN